MATETNRRCEPLSFSRQFIQAARLSSACKTYVISLRWPLFTLVFLSFLSLGESHHLPSSPTPSNFKTTAAACWVFILNPGTFACEKKTHSSWWISEILRDLESGDKCAKELLCGTSAWLIMRKEENLSLFFVTLDITQPSIQGGSQSIWYTVNH